MRIGAVGPSRLDAKTARTLPGRLGNGLPLHRQPALRRRHVHINRRPLGLGLQADRSDQAVQVARLENRRLIAQPAANAVGRIAEDDLARAFGEIVRDRNRDLDRLAISLERLQGDDRL